MYHLRPVFAYNWQFKARKNNSSVTEWIPFSDAFIFVPQDSRHLNNSATETSSLHFKK